MCMYHRYSVFMRSKGLEPVPQYVPRTSHATLSTLYRNSSPVPRILGGHGSPLLESQAMPRSRTIGKGGAAAASAAADMQRRGISLDLRRTCTLGASFAHGPPVGSVGSASGSGMDASVGSPTGISVPALHQTRAPHGPSPLGWQQLAYAPSKGAGSGSGQASRSRRRAGSIDPSNSVIPEHSPEGCSNDDLSPDFPPVHSAARDKHEAGVPAREEQVEELTRQCPGAAAPPSGPTPSKGVAFVDMGLELGYAERSEERAGPEDRSTAQSTLASVGVACGGTGAGSKRASVSLDVGLAQPLTKLSPSAIPTSSMQSRPGCRAQRSAVGFLSWLVRVFGRRRRGPIASSRRNSVGGI